MDEVELRAAMARYEWYHSIEVAPGIVTPGWTGAGSVPYVVDELSRHDLAGKRVLDIGCRDGIFCFAAERAGASEIIGIENDLSRGATEFLIPYFRSKVQMRHVNLYDFEDADGFDFVICAGVIYHLREPFHGLRRIAQAMRSGATLLLETAMLANHTTLPVLYAPAPHESPYKEATSVSFFNEGGLIGALQSFRFTDITCRKVLVPDFWPCSTWTECAEFLEPHRNRTPIIARAIYTARAGGADDSLRHQYWYGKHRIHSSMAVGEQYLKQEGYR
jgi:SAM-dependent methyltransferase